MNISNTEYEQKRHVFELCKWINEKLVEMETFSDFDTIYFERKGKNIKRLIEEAMPLAALGLYFFKPAYDVYLQFLPENDSYDAKLIITGFRNIEIKDIEIKVEVTTIETEDSTMRRQSLSRNGTVFVTGEIKRNGRNIISEPEMVDMDIENNKWIDLAYERCLKKINRSSDENTAILVSFSSFRHIPLRYRTKLIQKTQKYFLRENPKIYGVYYSYGDDFIVDGIKFDQRKLIY